MEEGFTWSLAPGCGLSIPISFDCDDVAILIDVSPAILPPRRLSRRLAVSVQGQHVLDMKLRGRSIFLVPIGKVGSSDRIELAFTFDDPISEFPNESRPLAFAFRHLYVLERHTEAAMRPIARPSLITSDNVEVAMSNTQVLVDMPLDDFMMTFESLGHSCDFGLFQRRCGAEPLGLLRFGGISTPKLIEGVLERFKALGQSGTIEAIRNPDWNNEYMVFDHSYGIVWHSFLTASQAAPEQLIARETYRLPLLKRIFLETVDNAEKTFVLRRPDHMDQAEAEAVAAVLRLTADNRLLWAVQDQGGAPGSVDFLTPYLMRGHLDITHALGSASIQAWLSICANVHQAKLTNNRV